MPPWMISWVTEGDFGGLREVYGETGVNAAKVFALYPFPGCHCLMLILLADNAKRRCASVDDMSGD